MAPAQFRARLFVSATLKPPQTPVTEPIQSAAISQPVSIHQPSFFHRLLARIQANPTFAAPHEFIVLIAIGLFLLLYGLAPHVGGDQLGLVGADEPRYAQVAREMLAEHNHVCDAEHADMIPHSLRKADIRAAEDCLLAGTVTPILYGKPWLEKPALYYWRAMSFFREFGVSDWSARLPSTSAAGVPRPPHLPPHAPLPPRRTPRRRPHHRLVRSPSSPSPAAPPPTCSSRRPSASACSAGTPGTKPARSSGSSISTSSAPPPPSPRAPSPHFSRSSSSCSFTALRREWTLLPPHHLVARPHPLLRHGAALVHRRPAQKPHLLP